MPPRQAALVSQTSRVSFDEVARVAAAIQRQVTRDLFPFWQFPGVVGVFNKLEDVPPGYSPVMLQDSLDDPTLEGVHYMDNRGIAYAVVKVDRDQSKAPWSLTASHEVLEIIVDPSTSWTQPGLAPDGSNERVNFLVEVCDPCQSPDFAYTVDGVVVSDFYGPSYFDPQGTSGGRYSMTNSIKTPRSVLPNGYLSFGDGNGRWWKMVHDGKTVQTIEVTAFAKLPGSSLREKIDAHSHESGYLARMQKVPTRLKKQFSSRTKEQRIAARLVAKSIRKHFDSMGKKRR